MYYKWNVKSSFPFKLYYKLNLNPGVIRPTFRSVTAIHIKFELGQPGMYVSLNYCKKNLYMCKNWH